MWKVVICGDSDSWGVSVGYCTLGAYFCYKLLAAVVGQLVDAVCYFSESI
jgi:hypothetical protein